MTHAEYCHNRLTRLNSPCIVFPDGVTVWQVGPEYLTAREMEALYPVTGPIIDWRTKQYSKGKNPNRKNNFKDL